MQTAVLPAELPSLSTSLGTRRLARLHMEPEPEPEPEPQPQLELKLRTPYPADVIAPDELQAAVQQLFDVFDVDSSATLTMDEYSMFCLATEGVDCDEERWRSHCQALSADPAIGLHCFQFAKLYVDEQFARHFGKLALDMPRAGLVPPPALLRASASGEQTGNVWQFESSEGWTSFGIEDQRQLEAALSKGELNPEFGGRQFDLQNMAQTNIKTNRSRNLRRVPSSATPRATVAAASDVETAEITVPGIRMHNGQFWMDGTLELFPTRLVFTPDQSLVRFFSQRSLRACRLSCLTRQHHSALTAVRRH
jgi:hypothetical protein